MSITEEASPDPSAAPPIVAGSDLYEQCRGSQLVGVLRRQPKIVQRQENGRLFKNCCLFKYARDGDDNT